MAKKNVPQSHVLCGHGLGPYARPNQRPVEQASVKEVEQRLARILQQAGKAFLNDSRTYRSLHVTRLMAEIAECRAHKGVKNTREALRLLGLQKFDI